MTDQSKHSLESGPAAAVPAPAARVAALMDGFRRPWALCGGWAVDAWLGRQTREHGDIDISVSHEDQRAIFEHLHGWQLLAHDRNWNENTSGQWDGSSLGLPAHIHCRSPEDAGPLPEDGIAKTEEGFWLEILVDERAGQEWVLRREPRVVVPLSDSVRQSEWGVPAVAPEVLLFFKATAYIGIPKLDNRPHDNVDFEALLPLMSAGERQWLRDAIASVQADHRWLVRLSWGGAAGGRGRPGHPAHGRP